MSRWWRAYDECLHDPKLVALSDEQHRVWFNLLCIASKRDGFIPKNIEEICIELRIREKKARRLISELVSLGLLDISPGGELTPHNWRKRQYKSDLSSDRVKRFRNVSETPPETETETETETEKTKDISIKKDGCAWPKDFRDQFWNAYPRKVGKGSAIRKLEAIRSSGEIEFNRLLTAIGHIEASDPKFIPHPTTWLNQGRYLDSAPPGKPPPVVISEEKVAELRLKYEQKMRMAE